MESMASKVTLTMDSDETTDTTATVYASVVILLRGAACRVSLADISLCSAGPCTFSPETTVLKAACRGRFHQCVTRFHQGVTGSITSRRGVSGAGLAPGAAFRPGSRGAATYMYLLGGSQRE